MTYLLQRVAQDKRWLIHSGTNVICGFNAPDKAESTQISRVVRELWPTLIPLAVVIKDQFSTGHYTPETHEIQKTITRLIETELEKL